MSRGGTQLINFRLAEFNALGALNARCMSVKICYTCNHKERTFGMAGHAFSSP